MVESAPSSLKAPDERSTGPLHRFLHLMTLAGFAVAQPLFEVLKDGPSFFVVRGSQPIDLWLLTIGLTIGPAAILFAAESLVGLAGRRSQWALHRIWIALLVGVTLAPILERGLDSVATWIPGAALVIGCVAAFAYGRAHLMRSFLDLLAPAPVLFAILFLSHSSISKLAMPDESVASRLQDVEAGASLVYVILDELPLTSMLTPEGEIDAQLFPNFARLASTSTWFRNATASNSMTTAVIPGLLTGQMPVHTDRLPFERDYPDNVFTLLGGAYRMRIHETLTRLCPRALVSGGQSDPDFLPRMGMLTDDLSLVYGHIVLPEGIRSRLPSVTVGWGAFRGVGSEIGAPEVGSEGRGELQKRISASHKLRSEIVHAFIDDIDASKEPTFYFLHVLLPHGPWHYLPSGLRHRADGAGVAGAGGYWPLDEGITNLAFQRHMLQVGYVDKLLGELIGRLEATESFDDSLVVVTADHGMSFKPGGHSRRATKRTVRDVIHVPLFVKEPQQRDGHISDRNVESMDLLPTIADALDIEIPWDVGGTSALDSTVPARPGKTVYSKREKPPFEITGTYPESFAMVEHKTRLFGTGTGWEGVYAMDPEQEWIGKSTADLSRLPDADGVAVLDEDQAFDVVDTTTGFSPSLVVGTIESGDKALLQSEFLLAVNGLLTSRLTRYEHDEDSLSFAAIVPDSAFDPGVNQIEVFAIQGDEGLARVPRLTLRFIAGSAGRADRFERSDGAVITIHADEHWGELRIANRRDGKLSLIGSSASIPRNAPADEVLIVFPDGRVMVTPTGHRRGSAGPDSPFYEAGFDAGVVVSSEEAPRLRLYGRIGLDAAPLRIAPDLNWGEE